MFRSFDPDHLPRLSGVYQGTGTTTSLATFSYASNGLVSARSEGSGNSGASYGWDDINRLTSQSDTFRFNVNNVAWGFTYNPASQIVTETRDNDAYAQAVAQGSTAYAINGLNQYTSVGGAAHTYDANGNLTSDGSTTYAYDVENRLVRATAGSTVTNLIYDPLGRLFQVDRGTSGTTTRFLHDGDALVAELNSSNAVTNRFVHGSNAAADDPLVWYSGSGLTNKRWLHADHLGSIVAWTNATGGSPTINRYDEYGVPAAGNSGRFQYTGQVWIGELALYYYKARFYDPRLGRFLQTDPVGYDDQINLYAYVGNDPINVNDPTGSSSSQTQGTEIANTCSRTGSTACSGDYGGSGDLLGTAGRIEAGTSRASGLPIDGETAATRAMSRDVRDYMAGRITESELHDRAVARAGGTTAAIGLLATAYAAVHVGIAEGGAAALAAARPALQRAGQALSRFVAVEGRGKGLARYGVGRVFQVRFGQGRLIIRLDRARADRSLHINIESHSLGFNIHIPVSPLRWFWD